MIIPESSDQKNRNQIFFLFLFCFSSIEYLNGFDLSIGSNKREAERQGFVLNHVMGIASYRFLMISILPMFFAEEIDFWEGASLESISFSKQTNERLLQVGISFLSFVSLSE